MSKKKLLEIAEEIREMTVNYINEHGMNYITDGDTCYKEDIIKILDK